MRVREWLRLLARGGPGFVQIALTNACNARCRFCNFSRLAPKDWIMADPARLRRGLGIMAAEGVRYCVFTGGEPLLYPHLAEILGEAQGVGLQSLLCTNGRLLNRPKIDMLQRAGVSHLIISIDAATAEEHEGHRGFPGLCRELQELLPYIKDAGITPVASVTISRLFADFQAMGDFLAYLGFNLATFSYPLTELHSTYLSYADHETVTFTAGEMSAIFRSLRRWKGRAPITVLNPRLGLRELERQLAGRRVRFPCLAGYKFFYIDWQLKVYRCHYLPQVLGALEDFAAIPPLRDDCHVCLIDCYRDASVQQFLAVSLAEAWSELCLGKVGPALGRLLRPGTFLSLGAILETRHWINRHGRCN